MSKEITKEDKYLDPKFWRIFAGLWSIAIFVVIVLDFMTNNGFVNTLGPMAAIYVWVLSIYSTEKEFTRWNSMHQGAHPGELYVIAWTILIFILFVIDMVLSRPYEMPEAIVSAYIAVVGILAVTKTSKKFYIKRHEG